MVLAIFYILALGYGCGGGGGGGSTSGNLTGDTTVNYTLALSVSPSSIAGTVAASPNALQYASGSVVTLITAAATGYKFKEWGGTNAVEIVNNKITMTGNKSVIAVFEASTTEVPVTKYTLSLSVSPSASAGTVTASPSAVSYDSGTAVTLTAAAATGYKFKSFGGANGADVVNNVITMNANKAVTAVFESSTAATVKAISVDASNDLGSFKLVMGSHNGPVSLVKGADETAKYREMGFKNIRTLDYYGPFTWYTIFPDFSKDPELESSYDFSTTDVRVKKLKDEGFDILFNFAPSWTKEVAINTLADPPGTIRNAAGTIIHAADVNDFKKFANIVKHIAMHYNAGWKNGYSYNIKKWEIWNEPETYNQFWNGTPIQFYQMFVEVAKTLRSYDSSFTLYGPGNAETIPMNNPNALDANTYTGGLLDYCGKNGVTIDVYTWHSYGGTGIVPSHIKTVADDIAGKLKTYNFNSTSMSCDEWNSGINASNFANSGKGAAFYGCALTFMVEKGLTEFYQYRGDDHPLGLLNDTNGQYKTAAYTLMAWKQMTESCRRLASSTTESGEFAVNASKSSIDGSYYAMVSNFTTESKAVKLNISNISSPPANGWTVTRKVISDTQKLEAAETGTVASDNNPSYSFTIPSYTVAFVQFSPK